ncbi:hypothetical protein B0A53_03481 [Rhodotorula sp. CCFEE 5036]|nr:hypothetical protein B0A53_03481 [Rhodotorula sp. CCFEE 5036]
MTRTFQPPPFFERSLAHDLVPHALVAALIGLILFGAFAFAVHSWRLAQRHAQEAGGGAEGNVLDKGPLVLSIGGRRDKVE